MIRNVFRFGQGDWSPLVSTVLLVFRGRR